MWYTQIMWIMLLYFCRAHFDYDKMKDNELTFQREDVFHIWDTMHDGVIGTWRAQIVTKQGQETHVGIIPNKSRWLDTGLYLEELLEDRQIVRGMDGRTDRQTCRQSDKQTVLTGHNEVLGCKKELAGQFLSCLLSLPYFFLFSKHSVLWINSLLCFLTGLSSWPRFNIKLKKWHPGREIVIMEVWKGAIPEVEPSKNTSLCHLIIWMRNPSVSQR